ncbi:MAG TPA: hypothetical protein VFZ49_03355 [Pyrinomonadaceae bacterium]
MDKQKAGTQLPRDRKNERGAALVTVMMVSFLLMVAVIALLLEASMNTANVTDATSEEQAYYAAESGIQSVIDALRHNPAPIPLIDPSMTPVPPDPDAHPANRLDYVKAVRLSTSNATTPTAADCASANPPPDCKARLSRWLRYDTAYPDRIVLGSGTYSPLTGMAYKVTVTDPDNVGQVINFSTGPSNIGGSPTYVFPADTNGNSVTVSFVPKALTVLPIPAGDANTELGSFVFSGNGPTFAANGATISSRVRFAISLNLTVPYNTTKVIRGYIEPGTLGIGNSGNVRIFFDSKVYIVQGSGITISDDYNGTIIAEAPPATPTGEGGTYRSGYQITPVAPSGAGVGAAGTTPIKVNMTAPEPIRLLIRSTGYGPRGSRKELEAVIQKNYFNGLGAPSPLTLVGPACTPVLTCTPVPNASNVAPNFVFQPGASTGTKYDGKDVQLKAFLPPIGVTNDTNIAQVMSRLQQPPPNKFNGGVYGTPSNIADELPFWLQNPKNLDDTLQHLRKAASSSGTLVRLADPRPASGGGRYGDFVTASGLTYVEGDLEFSQDGGGLLVVTGALTFKGGFKFNGLIVVTGKGGILRTGGGSGFLQGNMIVAPYDNWSKTTCMADTLIPSKVNCFYAPRYDISGGGSSDLQYNSNTIKNGLEALTNFVKGVAEK